MERNRRRMILPSGLGQVVTEADLVRFGDRSDLLGDPVAQDLDDLFCFGGIARTGALQHHEGDDGFALDVVRTADHGGFRHQRVGDQRRLDLHRAEAMAGHFQDIVVTPHDPDVAVFVAVGGIASEVVARISSGK